MDGINKIGDIVKGKFVEFPKFILVEQENVGNHMIEHYVKPEGYELVTICNSPRLIGDLVVRFCPYYDEAMKKVEPALTIYFVKDKYQQGSVGYGTVEKVYRKIE
jgi:hypothetical protein